MMPKMKEFKIIKMICLNFKIQIQIMITTIKQLFEFMYRPKMSSIINKAKLFLKTQLQKSITPLNLNPSRPKLPQIANKNMLQTGVITSRSSHPLLLYSHNNQPQLSNPSSRCPMVTAQPWQRNAFTVLPRGSACKVPWTIPQNKPSVKDLID